MKKVYKVILPLALWLSTATNVAAMTYCMPISNTNIDSDYVNGFGHHHHGIDIKVNMGDTIRATFDGEVISSGYKRGGFGKCVVISHAMGFETLYASLSETLVEVGTRVKAGEAIGLGGNTGSAHGVHLHFEVRLDGIAINPAKMFDFENQCMKMVGKSYSKKASTVDKLEKSKMIEERLVAHDRDIKAREQKAAELEQKAVEMEQKAKEQETTTKQSDEKAEKVKEQTDETEEKTIESEVNKKQENAGFIEEIDSLSIPKLLPLSYIENVRPSKIPGTIFVKPNSPPNTPYVVIEIIQPPPQPPKLFL